MIRNTYAVFFGVGELVNPDKNLLIFFSPPAICMYGIHNGSVLQCIFVRDKT